MADVVPEEKRVEYVGFGLEDRIILLHYCTDAYIAIVQSI